MSKKSLWNWTATLCNKIIISICILLLTLKIKTGHISFSARLMVTTFGRLDPYDHVVRWSHRTNKKRYISTSTRPMLAKLDKVEVYSNGPPSIESFDTLITRDQVITWQMKNVISQLPWDLWLPHLTEWWVLTRGYYPSSDSTCWPRGHRRSHDKWKMFWIHFHVTCCYQTWQKGGLWLGVTCPTTKPHIHSITWQINFVISLLSRGLTGWWLVMRSHHSKSSFVLSS